MDIQDSIDGRHEYKYREQEKQKQKKEESTRLKLEPLKPIHKSSDAPVPLLPPPPGQKTTPVTTQSASGFPLVQVQEQANLTAAQPKQSTPSTGFSLIDFDPFISPSVSNPSTDSFGLINVTRPTNTSNVPLQQSISNPLTAASFKQPASNPITLASFNQPGSNPLTAAPYKQPASNPLTAASFQQQMPTTLTATASFQSNTMAAPFKQPVSNPLTAASFQQQIPNTTLTAASFQQQTPNTMSAPYQPTNPLVAQQNALLSLYSQPVTTAAPNNIYSLQNPSTSLQNPSLQQQLYLLQQQQQLQQAQSWQQLNQRIPSGVQPLGFNLSLNQQQTTTVPQQKPLFDLI
eukprot:TRINITY_DN1072_c0_g1_i3.p1 TRINITY_DN1072_c0_g1~~TRINITY_DN1072_c0_g1_i3.p1  ORF type:complete len:347 (+),score=71.99 TRINITY_DN1072_c0_g1_i3:341-1381(+)